MVSTKGIDGNHLIQLWTGVKILSKGFVSFLHKVYYFPYYRVYLSVIYKWPRFISIHQSLRVRSHSQRKGSPFLHSLKDSFLNKRVNDGRRSLRTHRRGIFLLSQTPITDERNDWLRTTSSPLHYSVTFPKYI